MKLASELAGAAFRHLERAGSGSAGEVFKAVLRSDGSFVALKIARDDEARDALAREAEHARPSPSPRQPELVDVGWLALAKEFATIVPAGAPGSRAFIALRWRDGVPVATHAKRSVEERMHLALAVAHDVAEALEDLHGIGLAHGDVKPENLLVDGGEVSLIDLGLAAPLHARRVEGATPRYLARGDADLGDGRARAIWWRSGR